MSTSALIATAAVVGAIAGFAAGAFGGARGRDKAAVSATIHLSQQGAACGSQTIPAALLVGEKDVVQWTVTGTCSGVDNNNVEIRFVGPCQANGSKVAGTVPDLFTERPPHRGRKIKRELKHADEGCFAYEVWHGTTKLEDPELEIIQF
jgi:hypothetical protein